MSRLSRYILSTDLQLKWLHAVRAYSVEWVAGLKLEGESLAWFGFRLGGEREVGSIDIKSVPRAIGIVHYHPYEHSTMPIPSMEDGINWVYLSYWEISDDLNPIFFIVFRNSYTSWVMFPKPPILREIWRKEFENVEKRRERRGSFTEYMYFWREVLSRLACSASESKPRYSQPSRTRLGELLESAETRGQS